MWERGAGRKKELAEKGDRWWSKGAGRKRELSEREEAEGRGNEEGAGKERGGLLCEREIESWQGAEQG